MFLFNTSSDHKKVHLAFFALRALQLWEMARFFYLGKFGFNIFPDLISKQYFLFNNN